MSQTPRSTDRSGVPTHVTPGQQRPAPSTRQARSSCFSKLPPRVTPSAFQTLTSVKVTSPAYSLCSRATAQRQPKLTHLVGHRERSLALAQVASAGWHAGDALDSAGRVRGPVPMGLRLSEGFHPRRTCWCLLCGLKMLNRGVGAVQSVPRKDTQRLPLRATARSGQTPSAARAPSPATEIEGDSGSLPPPNHQGQERWGTHSAASLKASAILADRAALRRRQTRYSGYPSFGTAIHGGHRGTGPSPTEFSRCAEGSLTTRLSPHPEELLGNKSPSRAGTESRFPLASQARQVTDSWPLVIRAGTGRSQPTNNPANRASEKQQQQLMKPWR